MKLGLIGTGHIGAAMIENLAQTDSEIMVSKRSAEISTKLAEKFPNVVIGENDQIMAFADIVILAVRPPLAEEVLRSLTFRTDQKLLSVMAAVPFSLLEKYATPSTKIAVTIPLECISNGGCPLPVFGDATIVETLFGHNNPIIEVHEEAHLNAYFSASTVLTSVMDIMAASQNWLGATTHNLTGAEIYINALTSSYLRDLYKDGEGALETWRHRLAAEGTLNRQMLENMQNAGAGAIVKNGHDAILKRLTR